MQETQKIERDEVILAALFSFWLKGRKEVSLSEFLGCLKKVQEAVPLGYEFSERFIYSFDLFEDLRKIEHRGFANRIIYRHDAFLPKRYISLTEFGKSHVKKIVEKLPSGLIQILNESVEAQIRSYQDKWRLYARPTAILPQQI